MRQKNIAVCIKSMEMVIDECKRWAQEIGEVYTPDLIVFIAKSGFLFGRPMAEYFKCDMVDIIANRPANKVKDKSQKLIDIIPENWILRILSSPLLYKFHQKKNERNIELTDRYKREVKKEHINILIVDDSVDTGWTLEKVRNEVKKSFPNAIVKTAAYTVMNYSKERIEVDFYKYENEIILTATSRKSTQYETFLNTYSEWRKREPPG